MSRTSDLARRRSRGRRFAARALLPLILPFAAPAEPSAGGFLEDFERELAIQVDHAAQSLVTVLSRGPAAGADGRGAIRRTVGSGVVLDSLGYVLTTSSVVAGADEIQLLARHGRPVVAELVGLDPLTDIALLRAAGENSSGAGWMGASFGNSDLLRSGSWVTVLGNPFGAGPSVATGVVCRRTAIPNMAGERLIQMSVAVHPGDTGGAVINSRGEVVGVVCAVLGQPFAAPAGGEEGGGPARAAWGETGVGFAIPISSALHVVRRLRESGEMERGYLGVDIRDTRTPEEESTGVLVADVRPGSPADRGGLRAGDVLLAAGGQPILSALWLRELVMNAAPGSAIEFQVRRGAEERQLHVTLARQPAAVKVARPDPRPAMRSRISQLESELERLREELQRMDDRGDAGSARK